MNTIKTKSIFIIFLLLFLCRDSQAYDPWISIDAWGLEKAVVTTEMDAVVFNVASPYWPDDENFPIQWFDPDGNEVDTGTEIAWTSKFINGIYVGHYGRMLVKGYERPPGIWMVAGDRRFAFFQIITTPALELAPQSLWELEVIDSFEAPGPFPEAIAFDGTSLWIGADQIYKLDLDGNILLSGALPYSGFEALTFDGTCFWNLQTDNNLIDKIIHKLEIKEGLVKSVLDSFSSPGPEPADLSFNGTHLWNASAVADKIYKIDTAGTIVQSFDSPGTQPTGLAYDGTYLWNADADDDRIYKMDLSEDIIDSPRSYPTDLASDGTHLWVADNLVKKIYKIDSAGNILDSFYAPGGGSSGVGGLTFDGTYLWNANWKLDKIYKLDTAGNVIDSFDSPGGWPMGLAWDGTFLWNVDYNDRKIYKLTTTGTIISSFSTPFLVYAPKGLAFDGTYLWLVNSPKRIYKLTTGGVVMDEFMSPGPSASGLAFHEAKLWHSDDVTDQLYELIVTAPVIASFDSPGTFPYGLAFDGTYLWNADSDTNTIYKLSTAGIVVSEFTSPEDDPAGLTFDGSNLWSVDMMEAKIFKHDASGTIIGSLESPDLRPSGLAYDGTAWWNADVFEDRIYRLDILKGLITTSLYVNEDPPSSNSLGIADDGTDLWVSHPKGFGKIGRFTKYDEAGLKVAFWDSPGYEPGALGFDGTHMWHADAAEGFIFKMDLNGKVTDRFDYPEFKITDMATGHNRFWAVDSSNDIIYVMNKPGRVNVGSSRGRTFTITSTGPEDLLIGSLTITGNHAGQFHLLDDTCSGQTLARETDCTFRLEFSPSVPGDMQAVLEIPSNIEVKPIPNMPLSGTGVMGCSGDSEPDGDVDGMDLANYIIDSGGISLTEFSSYFGRNDCMIE
ncbi:MAG: choice-of-anchor D domain-containing protein [Desulfobacula sp.]|uniref:choice-of-anchor D domain-containing protein n=1 Tax=Desulfobacula sp. TaxID=2593537 RepID=UPI0025BCCDAB|nr:choice-of-anchor D domain-containing protein [Desulfobacula sp.]MCD4719394.1 choice-of-anchor D domain-containing protein [Desulfobacula sp.]